MYESMDPDLKVIDMPGAGNNCLLFAILHSVADFLTTAWIQSAAASPQRGYSAETLNFQVFNPFRAFAGLGQNTMISIAYAPGFLNWLVGSNILLTQQYNIIELHTIIGGRETILMRDGNYQYGAHNIALWNTGSHYQALRFSSMGALANASAHANTYANLFQGNFLPPVHHHRASTEAALPADLQDVIPMGM